MRTKKQVILVFKKDSEYFDHTIDILLGLKINFNTWTNRKYIRISQKAFKKHGKYLQLYCGYDNVFSSLV